jgi:pimeloyl-ACP methyl ester carboxylesterase
MVTARTADGLSLKGYYWHGASDDPDIIIFLHGRNWTASRSANAARHLTGAGNSVLIASYRGFDDNPGRPNQAGLIADAEAFVKLALTSAGPNARIWLVGHSLGAAVALHTAKSAPNVRGVFLLSPFARIAEAAPRFARGFIPDSWDNVAALSGGHYPVIMVQGSLDRFVPARSGDDLFSASVGPASLVVGVSSYHNPDMAVLSPWINEAIAAAQEGSLAKLPAPPAGWIEKVRRP